MKDPIEEALEKMQPGDLPPGLMARLTAARPQAKATAPFWKRWVLPITVGALAAVTAVALLRSPEGPHHPPIESPALAQSIPFERNDFLIGTREVGTMVAPDRRPYRVMEIEWLEREIVRTSADGPAIRIDTTRREIVPVRMEIF